RPVPCSGAVTSYLTRPPASPPSPGTGPCADASRAASTDGYMPKISSSPLTSSTRWTIAVGAASASDPPRPVNRVRTRTSTLRPDESQNSTPARSTTTTRSPASTSRVSAWSNSGAVLRSRSPPTARTAGGRLSEVELRRQVQELFGALQADGAGGAELRALLSELSRSRAQQGFTPSETAVSVFALKEALADTLDLTDPRQMRDFVAYSAFIDELGMFTV